MNSLLVSCVIDHLTQELKNDEIKSFTLISDGCNYQNRNKTLASPLSDFTAEKKCQISS